MPCRCWWNQEPGLAIIIYWKQETSFSMCVDICVYVWVYCMSMGVCCLHVCCVFVYLRIEQPHGIPQSPTWADPEYLQDTSEYLQDTSDGDGTTLQEGHIFAPVSVWAGTLGSCDPWLSSPQCPHSQKCPLADGSRVPCHFAQRVHLSFTQVRALEWFP